MDKIEILSVELLDRYRPLVEELKAVACQLQLEFGWHYLLDLTWILSHLGEVRGKIVMDAGAGSGILQWVLAAQGAIVISVDRTSRADLPWRFRRWTKVRGLRPSDLNPPLKALLNAARKKGSLKARLRSAWQVVNGVWKPYPPRPSFAKHKSLAPQQSSILETQSSRDEQHLDRLAFEEGDESPFLSLRERSRGEGGVWIYNQDLSRLSDLPDNSLTAVAALSALEHNPPQRLPIVIQELMRVLKPGGLLLATLAASPAEDWFHQPSQGWCYSESTLRSAFQLSPAAPSNYERYAELMEALRNCAELRENLASFYFRSGENGMPWGQWNPQYQSVGVLKRKTDS